MTCSTCKNAARVWCALALGAALCAVLFAAAALFKGDAIMTQKNNVSEMQIYPSAHSAPETLARLKNLLKEKNIPVFAEFDHAKAAREAGLPLDFTSVLVFGSPAVGTKLMQENQQTAAVLPLKILVWQDKDGQAYAGFVRMENIAARYGLEANPVIGQMKTLMENLALKAAS